MIPAHRKSRCDIPCPSVCTKSRLVHNLYWYVSAVCAHSKHDDSDDNKMNTLAFVNFYLSNFPKPDSSKFSTIKILCHMIFGNKFIVHYSSCGKSLIIFLNFYKIVNYHDVLVCTINRSNPLDRCNSGTFNELLIQMKSEYI